jgi:hypothetical protein
MDSLMEWCRAERAMMMDSIAKLESGRLRLGEVGPGGQVDQSIKWAKTLRDRVTELDVLLGKDGEMPAGLRQVPVGPRPSSRRRDKV